MESPVALSWQPPLFPSPAGPVERLTLEPGCWVDHAVAWLPGAGALFGELVATLPWLERDRMMYGRRVAEPRLTARWPAEGLALPRVLEDARAALSERYGVDLDSVGFNLYRDGGDSVAWHRDRIPETIERPVVALVSLGAPRPFRLRPRGGGASVAFNLGDGDLLVTGGQTQRRWEHGVPKQRSAGPRMSVAFRHSTGNGPD
jgi:alkylated DNA repair dioxygenase AlkB